MKKLSFAIIGGGPAAFYIGKCLSKLPQQPIIHIFEKEYCPFGLIRYGVAPDHVSIKKAQTTLSTICQYPLFQYYGNQPVDGTMLKQLKIQYSGIVYAIGAQRNNQPTWFSNWKHQHGQSHNNQIVNARDLVYWYNNYPTHQHYKLDLTNKRDVVIVGNGNVAIDIARILLKCTSELQHTEISQNALNALKSSYVQNVTLVGRRGFTHSAFALKEIRELTTANIPVYVLEEQLDASMNESSYIECTSISNPNAAVVRMNKRKIDFIKQKCHVVKKTELSKLLENGNKKVILRYLLDPIKIQDQHTLRLAVTTLSGQPFHQVAHQTAKHQHIHYDILVNSTGFKVSPIVDGQYDSRGNKISNSNGCVLEPHSYDKVNIGSYAVGWCKSGPKGVIDQTLLSCEQTFNNIRIHVENNVLSLKDFPAFKASNNINFQRYQQLKQVQLSLGNRQKYIKKKLNFRQIQQFFD